MNINDFEMNQLVLSSQIFRTITAEEAKLAPYKIYFEYLIKIGVINRYHLPIENGSGKVTNRINLWLHTLDLLPSNSTVLEFGVYRGRSINFMSNFRKDCLFYGFDKFEGLPEDWVLPDGSVKSKKGYFNSKRIKDKLFFNSNVIIKDGWFNETLPDFLKTLSTEEKQRVNLLHIDCDIYSSTVFVLEQLAEIIKNNKPFILFDEFIHTIRIPFKDRTESGVKFKAASGCESIAFKEFVNKYNINFEVIGQSQKIGNKIVLIKIL